MSRDPDIFDPISYGWVLDFLRKRKKAEDDKADDEVAGEDIPVWPV